MSSSWRPATSRGPRRADPRRDGNALVHRTPDVVVPRSIRTRVTIVAAAIALSAVAVLGRLVQLQVVDADRLRAKALRQHQQVIEVGGRRGSILDRQGRELAVSVTTSSLYAHPPRVKDPERTARLMAPVLGRPASEILGLLRSDEPF